MRNTLLVFIEIIFFAIIIRAQWVEMDYPGQGIILSLCNEGDTIYAGTSYHVVRSTNKGESWEKIQNGITPATYNNFNSLITGDGYLFVTQEGTDIYRSSDHGENWVSISNNLPALAKSFRKVYYKDGYLYVGLGGFQSLGFYYSTDLGDSWNTFSNGPDTTVTAIAKYGNLLLAGTINNKVFITTDNGISWGNSTIAPSNLADIRDFTKQGAYIFLTTGGYGVYRSVDGLNWESKSIGLPSPSIWTLPITVSDSNILTGFDYGSNGGIWKSTNDGDSWNNISGGRLTISTSPPFGTVDVFYKIYSLLTMDSTIFLGTYAHGLLKSTDYGTTWNNVITPMQFAHFTTLGTWGDTVAAGGNNIQGFYLSTDKGGAWNYYDKNLIGSVKSILKKGNIFFVGVGASGSYALGAYKSTDGGLSWNIINNGLPQADNNALIMKDDKLYSATDQGLYVSTNDGNSWNPTGWTELALKVFAIGNTMFLSRITPSATFRSTDDGATWDTLKNGFPSNFAAYSIVKINNTLFVCGSGNYKLFKSTDDGINWTQINSSQTSINVLDVSGETLFANHITPYFSTDLGDSWTQISLTGGPNTFESIKVTDEYFYGTGGGASGRGVYQKYLSSIVSVEENNFLVPDFFMLFQNYPNPFNPTTTIRFSLPQAGGVTLKIYNLLGEQVKTLINQEMPAGIHSVQFSANSLASGIYYYRIQTGSFVETKKMLLLK